MSEPLDPSTLPNRTVMKRAPPSRPALSRSSACEYSSPRRLVTPIMPTGLTALSVDTCRSEEHTSELQSLMRISYAVFCLKKKKKKQRIITITTVIELQRNTSQLSNRLTQK